MLNIKIRTKKIKIVPGRFEIDPSKFDKFAEVFL